MILNYKFENFMSFKEKNNFSMMAPKTKVKNRFPDNYVTSCDGTDVLKTAVIVGENAGGKTNFVRSIEFLKTLFTENKEVRAYKSLLNANNIVSNCPKNYNTCAKYEMEILVDNEGYYLYQLEIDFVGIVKEELNYKKEYKQKYKKILSAIREKYQLSCDKDNDCKCDNERKVRVKYVLEVSDLDEKIAEKLEESSQEKNSGLFINKVAILGEKHAIKFIDWMKDKLCPETYLINYDIYKTINKEEEDLRILNDSRYFDIFRMIDYSIIGIEIDEEKPFSKTLITRRNKDGKTFVRELGNDSSGVREFFAWAVQIFKVVYENKIVFADEMDRVLNPVLSDRIISYINGKKHRGQFIFTTHNVLHLDLKTYMKEQINFITKDIESLESEIYSLADFQEIRYETTKIYEFYMKGILGGTASE